MIARTQAARHLPSPGEIERVCRQIRSEWSPAALAKRIVIGRFPWRCPLVPLAEMRQEQEGHPRTE